MFLCHGTFAEEEKRTVCSRQGLVKVRRATNACSMGKGVGESLSVRRGRGHTIGIRMLGNKVRLVRVILKALAKIR
jgi:hypothetical protein